MADQNPWDNDAVVDDPASNPWDNDEVVSASEQPAAAPVVAAPEPLPLVEPNTTMFDSISSLSNDLVTPAEKQEIVDKTLTSYETEPEYQASFFGDSYKGKRFPNFYVDPMSGEVEVMNNASMEGIRDGLAFMAITAGDVVDFARSAVGNQVTDENSLGTALDEYFTEYDETRPLQAFGKEASGMLLGGSAVGKGASWLFKGLTNFIAKKAPTTAAVIQAGATGTGINAGTVAAIDPETSGLFVGENPMFPSAQENAPILQELNAEPGSQEYEQRLANRFALLIEAGAVGTAAEAGIKGTILVGKTMWSMTAGSFRTVLGLSNRTKAEEDVVRKLTANLLAAEKATNPADRKKFLETLSKTVADNEKIILNMDEDLFGLLEADQSTMNAFVSAVENGDMVAAKETVERARALQAGEAGKPMGGQTALAAQNTVQAAEEGFDTAITNLGGEESAQRLTTTLQQQGLDEVGAARQTVADIQAQLDSLTEATASDPNFEAVLNAVAKNTGIELDLNKLGSIESMRENLVLAFSKMSQTRKELYGEVTGGYLDVEDMVSKLREITPERLQMAASTMPSGPMKTLLNMAEPRPTTKMVDGVELPKTAEEILADEAAIVTDIGEELAKVGVTDYGSFFKVIRSELAQVKQSLFEAGQQGTVAAKGPASDFETFVNYIDEDLLKLADEDGLTDAVEAAKKYDRETFLVNWSGQGPLADIARSYNVNMRAKTPLVAQSADELVEDGGQVALDLDGAIDEFSPPPIKTSADVDTFNTDAYRTISNNLSEPYYGPQIVRGLRLSGKEGAENDAYDYILDDVLSRLSTARKINGAYKPEDLIAATESLAEYGAVIGKDFPEAAAKLKVLQDDIISGKQTLESLSAQLDEAVVNSERVSNEVFQGRLNQFFDANGLPKNTGADIWDKVFKEFRGNDVITDEGIGRFEQFVKGINDIAAETGDPQLIDGVRSAYLDSMRRRFFTNQKTSYGTRQLSLAALEDPKEFGRWMDGLRIVFKEADGSSPVAEVVETIFARAGAEQARGTRIARLSVGSNTTDKQAQVQALNSIVTMIFGPLSRTGARIGAIGRRGIAKGVEPELYESVTDDILSNPKLFAETLDRVIKKDYPSTRLLYEATISAFVRAGMVKEDDAAEMQNLSAEQFQTLLETETAINESMYEASENTDSFLDGIVRDMRALFQ